MSKDLPKFKPRRYEAVQSFASEILTPPHETPARSCLRRLIEYPDGHYRAVFDPGFFNLEAGQSAPSKSQWNTLKKKMKRHDPLVFIFKDHGETDCETGSAADNRCFYLDFGFFQH